MNLRERLLVLAALPLLALPAAAAAQVPVGPDTVVIRNGGLTLRALLWRPAGRGPFPAVLFNHGSGAARDTELGGTHQQVILDQGLTLGPVFARHGYVFLFPFRRGAGLSADAGIFSGDVMARELAAGGREARNLAQLRLLEQEELSDARAALAFLRGRPEVDAARVVVAGHSFGGSLTMLLAERDTTLRAVLVFAGAAMSWEGSPQLQARLTAAAARIGPPVLLVYAANDYSVAPGRVLAAELARRGQTHRLLIYPAFGDSAAVAHRLVHLNVSAWERDVFEFLAAQLRR